MKLKVCFVLDELYPYTKGGIGRLMWNIIQDSLQKDPGFTAHILWASSVPLPISESTRLIFHPLPTKSRISDADGVYAPEERYGNVWPLGTSLRICHALKTLEQEYGPFDAIEFPDFRGWSFATSAERLLGNAFVNTPIVVRCHASAAAIAYFEGTMPSRSDLRLYDIERKAFEMADIVIAHVAAVWQDYTRVYQFSKEIQPRVEFPQAVYPLPKRIPSPTEGFRDIVFAARYQKFKRPDVFVRGAISFIRSNPRFRGKVYLCAFASDEQFASYCQGLVPEDMRDRFIFSADKDVRAKAMTLGNVLVMPSSFEGLNLVTYESAAEGMTLILNEKCTAFQQPARFRDGETCFLFNGTVDSLSEALARAYVSKLLGPPPLEPEIPYFFQLPKNQTGETKHSVSTSRRKNDISVIVLNRDNSQLLPSTLESILRSVGVRTEVIVVDSGKSNAQHRQLLDNLAWRCAESGIRFLQSKGARSMAALRNLGAKLSNSPYVLYLDAGDMLSPGFLSRATAALDKHSDYDVVVPNIGYFRTEISAKSRQFSDYSVYIGDSPNVGWLENRFSSATAVFRRTLFNEVAFDEELEPHEVWTLFLELSARKKRFIVTNQVYCFRREQSSVSSAFLPPEHDRSIIARMQYQIARRTGARPPIDVVACAAAGDTAPHSPIAPVVLEQPALSIMLVDRLNTMLKRFPTQHAIAKRALQYLGYGFDGKPLRHDIVDKVSSKLRRAPKLLKGLQRGHPSA